ncbi:MAG: RNA-binding protein [Planctomycetota bacterium]
MAQRLYVGNLPYSMNEDAVRDLFATYGEVESVDLISDRETGRPRGFGFVQMANDQSAASAMEELNGKSVDGRALTVNEAKERSRRW